MLKECLNDGERISTLTVMQNLEITDTEYAALLALALWSPIIKSTTKTIEHVAQEARARIFHQLHLLYRMDNNDNYSIRFGELMILNGAFQVSCCKFREDIVLFNLFDVFEDTFMYDLVKR
ncbi:hypothetical protein TELCIR_02514 [Teladorsagia circumcincta]|uniref:NR LBD domain-containing protein n=1 Tax=Teladorsagia circumcincta TaxID=45464 RepID=A0A2G9UYX0_TELCI|nr:hypothetical protein TELCIR_02514 [Teladorsagia circumcincta]